MAQCCFIELLRNDPKAASILPITFDKGLKHENCFWAPECC